MEEVKLFGHRGSPFSCRVETALKLKGIKYEYVEEDLSNKSPLLLQYNPVYKKIPVLIHIGEPVVESVVILDETWKANPILPQDPYEKTMARFWAKWAKFVDEKVTISNFVMKKPWLPALFKSVWSMGEQYETDKAEVVAVLTVLENELKAMGKKFFGADRIGVVDMVANFIAFWLRAIQEALELDVFPTDNFPNLWEWAEDYVNCSDIKENLPPKDKLIANFPPPYMGKL